MARGSQPHDGADRGIFYRMFSIPPSNTAFFNVSFFGCICHRLEKTDLD